MILPEKIAPPAKIASAEVLYLAAFGCKDRANNPRPL